MTHKYLTKRSPHVSISYDKRNPYYEENFNKQLTKILEKLEENLKLFTVASCTLVTRTRAHAPNKTRGKPAGQDTSCYRVDVTFITFLLFYPACDA